MPYEEITLSAPVLDLDIISFGIGRIHDGQRTDAFVCACDHFTERFSAMLDQS